MAVKYRIYQSNRKGAFQGKWYGRAVHDDLVTIDDLADIMQNNCTVKRSDILAVISELVEAMTTQLQNSMKVKLDRFGTFKMGIRTIPADTAKEFGRSNIVGMHVLFQPELKIDAKGNRIQKFISGAKMVEITPYNIDKSDANDATEGDNSENA